MLISIEDITIQVGGSGAAPNGSGAAPSGSGAAPDGRRLFEHTSWTIEKDQNWGIIGTTGSGKSILAKAICRKLQIVQGCISFYFDGPNLPRTYLNPNEVLMLSSETHRDFLQQYAGYHQARWQSFEGQEAPTVADLLSAKGIQSRSPFEISPRLENEAAHLHKRDYAVQLLKLDDLLDRRVHTLSHGESRKVFLARLMMQTSRLLLLDDPYVGLDRETRQHLAQGIETLIAEGDPKILWIGSRIDEMPHGIDHLLVVQDGCAAAQGKREVVLLSPEYKASLHQPSQKNISSQKSPAFKAASQRYASALTGSTSTDSMPLIEMADVSVTYGDVQILKNISWTVRQGERWMLVGHNGAGKTTLLSLILADNPQSYANTISLFGKERGSGESVWEIKKNIGWVSPELQIYYSRTVSCLEVVCSGFFDSVGLYQTSSAEQMAAAVDWMSALGIEALANGPYSSLSAGQQRLVLLARALVKNPVLLILDEPCQGLDSAHRSQFIELIDQLCEHIPVTLIYVSHHQGEMPAATTHQLTLEHGRASKNGLLH
ncbi:MAG: ATP-binding cassette domain-containing protein [Anaerolineaceae bacterium]|nr:ATP-binding cassette domain-containing protein [Anaerolineaceae bacterium]